MISLSVIIPAYNCQSVINYCLDSIICSLPIELEFEIIVIDDCSRDGTLTVLRDYSAHHPNVKILRQFENHRQGAARNRGISVAQGKYITFVDADDIVEDGLANALKFAMEKDVDIVCARAYYPSKENSDGYKLRKVYSSVGDIVSGRKFCEDFFDFLAFEGTTPWGYLFKREYICRQYRPFVEDRQWEDNDWIAWHFYHAETVSCTDDIIYRYVCNPQSTMNRLSFSKIVDHISCCCRRMQLHDMMEADGSSFAAKVYNEGVAWYYIEKELSLKYWSVYKLKDCLSFYSMLGQDNLEYLKQHYYGSKYSRFVFSHKLLSLIYFILIIPVLKLFRLIKYGSFSGNKNCLTVS